MEHRAAITGLASELGRDLDDAAVERLMTYLEWLSTEAAPAGGVGPNEEGRLLDRHLLDSLVFLHAMPAEPTDVLDVGTGVGLPGIPLAIALPGTEVRLLDRSGRRISLVKRAIRMLELGNVVVEHAELDGVTQPSEVVVARAALPPAELAPHARRLMTGLTVVGGSSQRRPTVEGYETTEFRSRFFTGRRWLLIMRPP